jgi:hypothetical protein
MFFDKNGRAPFCFVVVFVFGGGEGCVHSDPHPLIGSSVRWAARASQLAVAPKPYQASHDPQSCVRLQLRTGLEGL